MMHTKKGIIFIVDAVLAVILIVMGIIYMQNASYKTQLKDTDLEFVVGDIMQSLSTLKVSEVNNSFIKELIADGNITHTDNSIIEQIGEFYSEGKKDLAGNISEEILLGLISNKRSLSLVIDDQNAFSINNSQESKLVVSKKLISGIQTNRTRLGYNARVFAVKSKKNNTLIVMGDVVYSSVKKTSGGNNNNNINLTYSVDIPPGATILEAYWFIEAAWTDNKFKAYINGDFIPGSSASGDTLLTDLESYILEGHNDATVEYRYGSSGEEGGDDGASHFVVSYITNQTNTLSNFEKKNYGIVKSNCSIRYKKPFFVIGTLKSIEVNLSLWGVNATLMYTIDGKTYNVSKKSITGNNAYWNDSEISSALSSKNFFYSNITDKYFWFVVDVDDYKSRENFGKGRAILNNSYVKMETTNLDNIYGFIDITKIIPVFSYSSNDAGNFYRLNKWQFNLTSDVAPLMLDSQLAWLYHSATNPDQIASSNKKILYSHPPSPLITEFTRFGYTPGSGNISSGSNNYTLNFSDGYSINPFNSLVDITVLVRSMVGYGDTFPTEQEAINDAKKRLNESLSGFVEAIEIGQEVASMGEVPSLWGPSIAEVRIWE